MYFEQRAPLGYVQLYHGQLEVRDGPKDLGRLQIDVMAPSLGHAQALDGRVRGALDTTPVRPTPFKLNSCQVLEEIDHTRIVLIFETRDIGVPDVRQSAEH
ncbi:hypothetical protein [Deinococcus multiflagellatus]|uniref:Uncharacterized protein n=1 Tax=Deinococcus multiflagellatus TaxID=1656887 RepID=A0ABW1ZQZ7_9DEIO